MWYVARKPENPRILLSQFTGALLYVSLAFGAFGMSGCSLRILGVDPNEALPDGATISTADSNESGSINSFSVLGATGGSDATADSLLTDGTTLTVQWVDTTGEDSYEVRVFDGSGSTTLCGPATVAADTTSHTFASCALSHGTQYRIQVTAKNSSNGAAQSAQNTFQVGPFLSVGDVTVGEWGVASVPVTLSYASPSTVTVQYVTVDSSAQAGSDYLHSPLSTLTIPAGQTSASIPVSIASDRSKESSEEFRIELSSPSGAGILTSSARATIQDNDYANASGFAQVAAGNQYSCGITTAGALKCWGTNTFYLLGTNTINYSTLPIQIPDFPSGVSQIAAGGDFVCALTTSGGVKCWGRNDWGQLGDNTTTFRATPVEPIGLSSGVSQIVAGNSHTCALTTAGGAKCWGFNAYGQGGNGTTTATVAVPTDVSGLSSGVAQLAAGGSTTCAVTTAGAVRCWGANSNSQIGDGTTTQRLVPTTVLGLSSGGAQVTVGYRHACATTTAGALKCWGYNLNGQIGDNTSANTRSVPTDVIGLSSGIVQVKAGNSHTCALTSLGAVKCWGANSSGQIGDNFNKESAIPADVVGLASGTTQISTGLQHTCALSSAGSLQCWGSNGQGEVGVGVLANPSVPSDVATLFSGVNHISAGYDHTCALASSGAVKCWGNNGSGALGNNTTISSSVSVDTVGLPAPVTQIATGSSYTCALTSAGTAFCWGYNMYGQLGDNTVVSKSVPTAVEGLSSGITQITAGAYHACALNSSGGVKCWGYNLYGQLGDNTSTNRSVPTDVLGLSSGVTQVAAGQYHTCALTMAGAVLCWGRNIEGQLGDNTTTYKTVPTSVTNLSSSVTRLALGSYHSCAIRSSGGIQCWGKNVSGQIGDNTTTNRLIPTDVIGATSGFTGIAAGIEHTCALTSSGAAKCWGTNGQGALGDGTSDSRSIPTDVSGLASGASQISAGAYHTCAVTQSGSAKCWGRSHEGQLGTSQLTWTPQSVATSD